MTSDETRPDLQPEPRCPKQTCSMCFPRLPCRADCTFCHPLPDETRPDRGALQRSQQEWLYRALGEREPDRDTLREQIKTALRTMMLQPPGSDWYDRAADVVLAVVEPALAQRDADKARLIRELDEAQRIQEHYVRQRDEARSASAECYPVLRRDLDDARRVVAAVEALCGQIERNARSWLVGDEDEDAAFTALIHAAGRIRAALAGDQP